MDTSKTGTKEKHMTATEVIGSHGKTTNQKTHSEMYN